MLVVLPLLITLASIAIVTWWYARTPADRGGPGSRLALVADWLRARFGPAGSLLLLVVVGGSTLVSVGILLGLIAKHFQHEDLDDWFWVVRQRPGWWTSVMRQVTKVGSNWLTRGVVVGGAVVIAAAVPRQRWRAPALVGALVLTEHYGLLLIGHVVDRRTPPGSHGTFPSGGAVQSIALYGTLAWLICHLTGASERSRTLWAGAIAAFGATEAYSRWELGVHWRNDVVGGVVFGVMTLALFILAARTLFDERDRGVLKGASGPATPVGAMPLEHPVRRARSGNP